MARYLDAHLNLWSTAYNVMHLTSASTFSNHIGAAVVSFPAIRITSDNAHAGK